MSLPRAQTGDKDAYRIVGGAPIRGDVTLSGSKNTAPKQLLAALLADDESTILDAPKLGEMAITADLVTSVGAQVRWDEHACTIDARHLRTGEASGPTARNRTSILSLGPLLHRFGRAFVPRVGGDRIGKRPVDFHVQALEQMGAQVTVTDDGYEASAPDGLHSAKLTLPYPSVGATETILLASVLAPGQSIIVNAAVEPEVNDLIAFLQKMGAIIELGTHRTIVVEGVKHLHGATHRVIRDRNEAVSFACAALATHGEVTVLGADQQHLITFLNTVRRIGGDYEVRDDGITFRSAEQYRAIAIETDTHPGYMTDWQQPLGVVLTQATGISTIHETVYENRMGYMEDLARMGAQVHITTECLGSLPCRYLAGDKRHSCTVTGPTPLHGTHLDIPDIRAGFAHVIGALVADGESVLTGVHHLDRGYANLDDRLQALGANLERITGVTVG